MSGHTYIKRFRVCDASVPAARHHVEALLRDWKLGDLIDAAALITSELVTNVVNHAGEAGEFFEVGLRHRDGVLILEVSDSGKQRLPHMRQANADDVSGRGLVIVDALAEKWGVRLSGTGKKVWAHLPVRYGEGNLPPRPAARTTYRFRDYALRPDTEPDMQPHTFTMRCAVCDAVGPTSEEAEDGTAWAARHLKASPDHLSYRETITRPYRFRPEVWR